MTIEKGLILYTIEKDGGLNGIYTNEAGKAPGEIFGEIAKKRKSDNPSPGIQGIYDSVYFEHGNPNAEQCELEINCNSVPFTLSWKKHSSRKVIWQGYGYQMRQDLLVVHYRSAP